MDVKLIAASTKQQVTCSIPPSGPYTLCGGGVVPITSLSLEAALHAHFRVEIKISWLSELPNNRVGKQGRFCNLLWRSLKTWYNLTYRRWFFAILRTDKGTWCLSSGRTVLPLAFFPNSSQCYTSPVHFLPPRGAHALQPLSLVFIDSLVLTPFFVVLWKAGESQNCPITHTYIVWW